MFFATAAFCEREKSLLPKQPPELLDNCVAGLLYAVELKYFVFPSNGFRRTSGRDGVLFHKESLFLILYAISQLLLVGFAFMKIRRTFAFHTLLKVGTVMLVLTLLPPLQFANADSGNERIILVLFGRILSGIAKPLSLRIRRSTGDEDILAAYSAIRYHGYVDGW
jgi:uncharacterized membrane-anchored protein YitT (DUF2179 family)